MAEANRRLNLLCNTQDHEASYRSSSRLESATFCIEKQQAQLVGQTYYSMIRMNERFNDRFGKH